MTPIANDYLTGLYTRQQMYMFYEKISPNHQLHFMFMDVDNFKTVNDVYGHNTGDLLLKGIAKILLECAPDSQVVRLGGDEFVLVFEGNCSREYLCGVADDIQEKIRSKKGFSQISTHISASIGILYDENSSSTMDEILLKSDMAMYHAKNHGKGRYVVFNDIAADVFKEIDMEKHQQEALENGEFKIYYLPVMRAQTSLIYLSQVRLLWQTDNGQTITPSEFLPLFEKNGFIRQLNIWVLHQICHHLQENKNYFLSDDDTHKVINRISVRISKLLLQDMDFPDRLKAVLDEHNIDPQLIELEVNETAFERSHDVMFKIIQQLKDLGFGFSIINLGTDFSSIRILDKLFPDSIKFDAEYLNNALKTPRGRQIVKTLLALGRELKIQVVADGISNREDVKFLTGCGCNAISGSYYSAARELNDYLDYIKDKIKIKTDETAFRFKSNLFSDDKKFEGKYIGGKISFTDGISKNWGAIYFPGGNNAENIIEIPSSLLTEESYTICMWLKPVEENFWSSAFFGRYFGGFISFVPHAGGGNAIFRISEDANVMGFHDVITRQTLCGKWTFICISYNSISQTSRTYINGKKSGFQDDIPVLPVCKQIILGGDIFQPSYHGYISGFKCFNHVKSDSDIWEIYQQFCSEEGFAGEEEGFWE